MLSIERSSICSEGLTLRKVDDFSVFQEFECGDDDLNDFIRNDAEAHGDHLLAETYSLHLEDQQDTPVAFISFCNDAVPIKNRVKNRIFPAGKRYHNYPAVKIARLGVHAEFHNQNLGSHMLNMSKEFFLFENRTGCRFMTVDAYKRPEVISFYQKNDFAFLSNTDENQETRTMYFDLKRMHQ